MTDEEERAWIARLDAERAREADPAGRLWDPDVSLFEDRGRPTCICGVCGGGYRRTVAIRYCRAARFGEPKREDRMFICAACLAAATRALG